MEIFEPFYFQIWKFLSHSIFKYGKCVNINYEKTGMPSALYISKNSVCRKAALGSAGHLGDISRFPKNAEIAVALV